MTDVERSEPGSGKGAPEIVLITGASGFIAAALIARLGERYTVVGLDRAGPPDPPPPAAAVAIDLGSDEAVRAALEEVRARYGCTNMAVRSRAVRSTRLSHQATISRQAAD